MITRTKFSIALVGRVTPCAPLGKSVALDLSHRGHQFPLSSEGRAGVRTSNHLHKPTQFALPRGNAAVAVR